MTALQREEIWREISEFSADKDTVEKVETFKYQKQ
jgi:hypothetical protein